MTTSEFQDLLLRPSSNVRRLSGIELVTFADLSESTFEDCGDVLIARMRFRLLRDIAREEMLERFRRQPIDL